MIFFASQLQQTKQKQQKQQQQQQQHLILSFRLARRKSKITFKSPSPLSSSHTNILIFFHKCTHSGNHFSHFRTHTTHTDTDTQTHRHTHKPSFFKRRHKRLSQQWTATARCQFYQHFTCSFYVCRS